MDLQCPMLCQVNYIIPTLIATSAPHSLVKRLQQLEFAVIINDQRMAYRVFSSAQLSQVLIVLLSSDSCREAGHGPRRQSGRVTCLVALRQSLATIACRPRETQANRTETFQVSP